MVQQFKIIFRRVWYFLCVRFFILLSDRHFSQFSLFIHSIRFNIKFRFQNYHPPKSFSEKINFLKLVYRHDLGPMVADKVAVREFVKDKIGENYLVPLIGIYNDASEIDFDLLPKSFILKTNHGSGWNFFCLNKNYINQKRVVSELNRWLTWNAFFLSREWQYQKIFPQILCEKMLEYEIFDYKIFCFDGQPEFIQVDVNRFSKHERVYFDSKWNKQDFTINHPKSQIFINKPKQLLQMLSIAKKLSVGLIFSRIDLYIHNEQIFFSEITLHPEGGNCIIIPESLDHLLSDKLNLKNLKNSIK